MVHNDSCDNFKRNNNFERRIFFPETGQLETVGNGFQLNNKLLERALIDYLESIPQQVFVFSLSSLFFFFLFFFRYYSLLGRIYLNRLTMFRRSKSHRCFENVNEAPVVREILTPID